MEILHTKSRFLPLINMETSGNQESIFLLEIITMSSGCRQQFVRYSMCPFLISFLFSVTCQLHLGSHTPGLCSLCITCRSWDRGGYQPSVHSFTRDRISVHILVCVTSWFSRLEKGLPLYFSPCLGGQRFLWPPCSWWSPLHFGIKKMLSKVKARLPTSSQPHDLQSERPLEKSHFVKHFFPSPCPQDFSQLSGLLKSVTLHFKSYKWVVKKKGEDVHLQAICLGNSSSR